MRTRIGTKANFPMAFGVHFPGIVVSDEAIVPHVTKSGDEIEVTRADVLTLRTTLAGEKYLALSNEVIQYGYLVKALPRFDSVVGLDVTVEGEIITLANAMNLLATARSEWNAVGYAARNTSDASDV